MTIHNYLLTPDIRVPYIGHDKEAILAALAAEPGRWVWLEFAGRLGHIRSLGYRTSIHLAV